jgi:phospholipid transport system substrate-binding protein
LRDRFASRPGARVAGGPLRRSRSGRRLALLLALAALAGGAARAADPEIAAAPPPVAAAREGIEELHATLLGVMKEADALGFQGRLERIRPVLLHLYDFAFMAEKSVGLGWRDLDESGRARLVDAFSRLAIATYAARFDGYDGARFETLGVQPASHDTVLVKTRIVRGSGETVALDYRMRAVEGSWRIIDVFMNGTVSELALRRAEYSGVLKRQGFDALLEAIEQKIAAQERGAKEA